MMQQPIGNTSHRHSLSLRRKSNPKHQTIGNLRIGNKIGHGTYGTVYEAYKITTCEKYAVKILSFDNQNYSSVKHQANLCKKIYHKNIVKVEQIIQTQNKIYIVMEFCQNGQLFDFIKNYGPVNQQLAAKIFLQLHSAVQYLHLRKIAHRDIKSQNVLLDAHMNPKLIDFGLSKEYSSSNVMMETFCGSPSYVAPQIIRKQKYNGEKVDVWSLGVTLYIMLEAAQPFFSKSGSQTKHKIANLQWSLPHHSSIQAKELYQVIFVEASERVTLCQMEKSNFFEKYLKRKTRFESKSTQKTQRMSTGECLQLKNPQKIIVNNPKKQSLLSLKNIIQIDIKQIRNNHIFYNSIVRGQPFLQFSSNKRQKKGKSSQMKNIKLDFRVKKNSGKYGKMIGQTQNVGWFKREVISDLNHY